MDKYILKIDLNVLNHLGLNLYSNVAAVLSELIANAWDADSTEVNISISTDEIKIEDNGCGMNEVDLNEKFLTVGHQRRSGDNGDLTPKLNRRVMGRKGIGKLSVFSIAEHIEIYTKQSETLGLSMKVDEIRRCIEEDDPYHPKEEAINEVNEIKNDTGTRIILREIKRRVQKSVDNNLKKRIARRFDIWGNDFKVSVNNQLVAIEDRGYFQLLEFAKLYGNYHRDRFNHIDDDKLRIGKSSIDGDEISGWIGLVTESKKLQNGNDNLNKISILCRGKLALEDIFELYGDGGMYTKYIIGEIRADFLDITEKEDITTSNRQNFIQGTDRFMKLKQFIRDELDFIERARNKYKDEQGVKKAQQIPAVKEWFSGLKSGTKNAAVKLFGKINQIATDEEHRKTLYKHGILAFEHLHHKEKLQQLEKLNIENLEATVELFSELDDIEATWYHEITRGRLDMINKLTEHIDENALEKIIQEHIHTHLWLIDPSWDRATETPSLEKTVTTMFEKLSNELNNEEKKARLDIRYKKTTGKHIIIELKRSSVRVSEGMLSDQLQRYRSALKKQLDLIGEQGAIECICLLGKLPRDWDNPTARQEGEDSFAVKKIRVITYRQLINDAQIMYQSYLDKEKDRGRISKLLEAIDKD